MEANWLSQFLQKFVLPHFYLWEPILRDAFSMNWAKYFTLGAWVIFWLGFLIIKRQNGQIPLSDEVTTTDPKSRKSLIWIVIFHFVLYFFLWSEIGGLKDIPVLSVSFYPAAFTFGLILLIIGVIFSIVSRYYLGSGQSFLSLILISPFIKEGPFKYTRHPIYLGIFIIWLGASLIFFNWIGIFSGLFLLLPLLIHRAKTEEKNLIETLDIEYQNYINATGSIFPKFL